MEATHMPPVENHLCDTKDQKKTRRAGWFFRIIREKPRWKRGFFLSGFLKNCQLTLVTSAACGPFWPCTTSNSTLSPSARDLKPLPPIALKWTKTSGPPSREIKPNPLASLNHFTVPVMRAIELILSPRGKLKIIYHRLATLSGSSRFAGYSSA